jgi:protein-disulfide isomerase
VSRSEERRKAREQGGSDMTKFYVVLGVVAAVGISAVVYSIGSTALGAAAMEPIEVEGLDDQDVLVAMAQGVTKGDEDAPITIVEFGDYACPGCGGFAMSVKPQVELLLIETGKAKFVFYDFPLTSIHPTSFLAARTARCAEDQDKFWEYHDALFRNQTSWRLEASPISQFLSYGEDLGLDSEDFESCVKSDRHADLVSANMRLGYEMRVSSTPTIMVQGNDQLLMLPGATFPAIQAAMEQIAASVDPSGAN